MHETTKFKNKMNLATSKHTNAIPKGTVRMAGTYGTETQTISFKNTLLI